MSGRLLLSILGAFVCAPAAGMAEDAHCQALGRLESGQTRAGAFNPDDLLNLSARIIEAGGDCEGTARGWAWELRGSAVRERFTAGATATDTEVSLRQLHRSFDVADRWSLTVGRKRRGWDVAYVAQPIDFLGDPRDTRDLEDRLGRRRASTFVALDRIGAVWTTSLIAGENRQYADLRAQAIVSAERSRGGTNVQLIAQKPAGQPRGAGAAASAVTGTSLELHASVFTRRGTRRPIHLSLVDEDFRFYAPDENPVGAHRLHDDRWYPRWVLGGQWTAESGLNVLLEWSHDERGLSPSQWRHLIALARFHAAGAAAGVPAAAVAGNIAFDAAALARSGANMQDYVFLRLAYPFGRIALELSALVNAHHRSASAAARAGYPPSQRFEVWLDLHWNHGSPETEFGEVPVAREALLGFRYFF